MTFTTPLGDERRTASQVAGMENPDPSRVGDQAPKPYPNSRIPSGAPFTSRYYKATLSGKVRFPILGVAILTSPQPDPNRTGEFGRPAELVLGGNREKRRFQTRSPDIMTGDNVKEGAGDCEHPHERAAAAFRLVHLTHRVNAGATAGYRRSGDAVSIEWG